MATKRGAGGAPQEYDESTGRYGSGNSAGGTGEQRQNSLDNYPGRHSAPDLAEQKAILQANGKQIPLAEDGTIDEDEVRRMYSKLPPGRRYIGATTQEIIAFLNELGKAQAGQAPVKQYGNGLRSIHVGRKRFLFTGTFEKPYITSVHTATRRRKKR